MVSTQMFHHIKIQQKHLKTFDRKMKFTPKQKKMFVFSQSVFPNNDPSAAVHTVKKKHEIQCILNSALPQQQLVEA